MGRRSRSRSPRKERRRSRSKERDRRPARRSRSPDIRRRRSRSPRRRSRTPERDRDRRFDRRDRSRSRDRGKESDKPKIQPGQLYQRPPLDESAFEGKSEEEIEMMKIMGFGDFDTTKGKKVPGNNVSGTNIIQKRRYRQYMNRRGGFNRPLDSIA